jgi:AcrR family transcriptional regulator
VPKIDPRQSEENRRRIAAAALKLFTTRGFHGTRTRDIAEKIGLSDAAIYTYFPSKEAIFADVASEYRARIDDWLTQTVKELDDPLAPTSLKKLAAAIRSKMEAEPEFLLLLLNDVIEFNNQHFSELFRDVPQRLRRAIGPALERIAKEPGWRGGDPAFVLASMYLYFFTYALVERQMQGERHLGLASPQALDRLIDLLTTGLFNSAPEVPHGKAKAYREYISRGTAIHKSDYARSEYLRFLSGRLWGSPPDAPPDDGAGGARPVMLFLPDLSRNRVDENQLRLEAAALDLFTHQGFHGTNMREIAERSGLSQGSIYLYYQSKEAIFEGLAHTYGTCMRHFIERLIRSIEEPFARSGLRFLATAIRCSVYGDAAYWRLLYIDVIEFGNRHFARALHDMPQSFRRVLGPEVVRRTKTMRGWCGEDPGRVMAILYLYFTTYFTIERVMHGNRHLGVGDDEVIERLVDLMLSGLWDRRARKFPRV